VTVRILVVDDDPLFREQFRDLLKDGGHTATSAPSVQKALETLEHDDFDVVMADLRMPRHGGLELLREVRSRWPRTFVVIVTGFATVETALDAMKLGAFDYLQKPFRIEQVRQTLALVGQELEFGSANGTDRDPIREAHTLAEDGKYEVLLFTEEPATDEPHLHVEPLDPVNLTSLADRTERFLQEHPNAAVVVSGVEKLLEGHRLEDVVVILDRLRMDLAGHGPLRVAFNPHQVAPSVAAAVGGAVSAEETHDVLEALSNPIRRRIVLRLDLAPASFGEAMQSAELDDSPKMAFHLRKLAGAGLLIHERDSYRLTARGSAAARLLSDAALLPPAGNSRNLAFPGRSAKAGVGPRGAKERSPPKTTG
jgi:CheY-like chemotaxis protein/DNA-binding transcriptional ArsR family regulator